MHVPSHSVVQQQSPDTSGTMFQKRDPKKSRAELKNNLAIFAGIIVVCRASVLLLHLAQQSK